MFFYVLSKIRVIEGLHPSALRAATFPEGRMRSPAAGRASFLHLRVSATFMRRRRLHSQAVLAACASFSIIARITLSFVLYPSISAMTLFAGSGWPLWAQICAAWSRNSLSA